MDERYHIFISSSSCYASVVKQSYWLAEEYSQISKTLNSGNRKVPGCLPKRNFHAEFFLAIFRVSAPSKCFERSITLWLNQTRLHHKGFRENVYVSIWIGWGQEIYIFLVSQIIIVFVKLCKSDCRNLIG